MMKKLIYDNKLLILNGPLKQPCECCYYIGIHTDSQICTDLCLVHEYIPQQHFVKEVVTDPLAVELARESGVEDEIGRAHV